MSRLAGTLLFLCFLTPALPGASTAAATASPFDKMFSGQTMRVDYFHTGDTHQREIIALDRVVNDGAWPGSRTRLVDDTNLGTFLFEVIDRSSNQVIYSRGFASIYGEWETTAEAKTIARTFQESLRFPWPRQPVQVVIKRRDRENSFHEIWSTVVDPNSRFVNRALARPAGMVWPIVSNGSPQDKVDIAVLSEGYTEAEIPKFHADAMRLVGALFDTEPFKSRKKDFNVWGIDIPNAESGVNRPRTSSFHRTPLSAEYNIFDSERYVLTFDNRALRDAAASAPYEFLEILVNEKQYGGGGIYNFEATASVDSAFSEYVFVHEFGHHFAGLGDEYYTSAVSYATGAAEHPEPWEPNITALLDPALLKWRDLVTPGTPLPTPWDREVFEKKEHEFQTERARLRSSGAAETEMDRLFRAQEKWETSYLASMKYSGRVGAFEGAGYEAKGLYRPEADCIMFSRDKVGFCRVCARAIERIIDQYSRRSNRIEN